MKLKRIATRLINQNRRSVEVEVHYSDGSVMTHYMSIEDYKHMLLRDQMIEKYGISDEDFDKIEETVRDCVYRDQRDEEAE